jgi:hypothetical protein
VTNTWTEGEPDLVLTLPQPFEVPARGDVPLQFFLLYTEKTEDRWIESIEFRPGAKSVVHHSIVIACDKPPDPNRSLSAGPETDGDCRRVTQFVPGVRHETIPGHAYRLRRGTSLYVAMHYVPDGVVRRDQTKIGLRYARGTPRELSVAQIRANQLEIPPGVADHVVISECRLADEAKLFSLNVHMHLRGKIARIEALFPDQKQETLLVIPAYNAEWEQQFYLKNPRMLPKETVLRLTAHFDNSADNPYNPDPKATVRWGQQLNDEMLVAWVGVGYSNPTSPLVLSPPKGSQYCR